MSHQVYDKDGKLIDATIVPDKGFVRVGMTMMDAAPPDIAAITRAALTDAPDLARHRPGTLVIDGTKGEIAATLREAHREHRLSIMSDAWRNPVPLDNAKAAASTADTTDPDSAANARDQRLRDAWVNA